MKTTKSIARVVLPMIMLLSCDEPETILTNTVHPDGSVSRRVVMKTDKEEDIDPADYRVPVDSTWSISKVMEVTGKDTFWITTAKKTFTSVEEINREYLADGGANKLLDRQAGFSKSFRWFNTIYRFSETVSRILTVGLKVEDYMNREELDYFYMPPSMTDSLLKSADSLMYRQLEKRVDSAGEIYLLSTLVEEWVAGYLKLVPDSAFIEERKNRILENIGFFDDEDSVLMEALGEEYYLENRTAIDTAFAVVDSLFGISLAARFYTCEMIMPGSLISTNGFVDMDEKVSWPVKSDYFVAQDYVMWAESKEVNYWAWWLSGLFVLFVLTGLMVRWYRKT